MFSEWTSLCLCNCLQQILVKSFLSPMARTCYKLLTGSIGKPTCWGSVSELIGFVIQMLRAPYSATLGSVAYVEKQIPSDSEIVSVPVSVIVLLAVPRLSRSTRSLKVWSKSCPPCWLKQICYEMQLNNTKFSPQKNYPWTTFNY